MSISNKTEPIPDFDKWLVQHEGAGILAWLVEGYLDYQANGLHEPTSVTTATDSYRGDSDPLGDFLSEHCVTDQNAEVQASELYRVYSEDFNGQWKQASFGRAMAEWYTKTRPDSGPNRKKTVYQGVRFALPMTMTPLGRIR